MKKADLGNYIEVELEMNWSPLINEELELGIAFIGQEPKAYDTFRTLQKLYQRETGKELKMDTALNNMYSPEEEKEVYNEFIDLYPDYKEDLKDFKAVAKELTQELFELITLGIGDIKKLITTNKFRIGTVGRSNWSYYMMYKEYTDERLPNDLWTGHNFYTVSRINTDENGQFLGYHDSIHHVYAPDINDIFQTIEEYFGLKKADIYLLDNQYTHYIQDVSKLTKSTAIYYEPKKGHKV